jgi:hypothetical protein
MRHDWKYAVKPSRFLGSLALLIMALGCNPKPAETYGWFQMVRNENVTLYLDTVRIRRSGDTATVWLRAEYAAAMPKMASTTGPYNRADLMELVNCKTRRARNAELRLVDSTNAQVGDTTFATAPWLTFEDHPLSLVAFEPVCEYLKNRHGA